MINTAPQVTVFSLPNSNPDVNKSIDKEIRMKKRIAILSLFFTALLIQLPIAYADILKYTSKSNDVYYVAAHPVELTSEQKALFMSLTDEEVDAITPVILSNRYDVQAIVLADTAPVIPSEPECDNQGLMLDSTTNMCVAVEWVKCADVGALCNIDFSGQVARIGKPGQYLQGSLPSSTYCEPYSTGWASLYGEDFTGVSCEIRRAASSVTPPNDEHPTDEHPNGHGNMPHVDLNKEFTPVLGYADKRIEPAPDWYKPGVSGNSSGGQFRIECGPSHQSNDDPIVYPGQEGAAHHHTFFGNTGTDYNSTPESLKESGNSTCHGGIANRSAYWLPSLIDTTSSTPLKPEWALFYYKGGDAKVPNGLVMIAGDGSATKDNPQPGRDRIQWQCNSSTLGAEAWMNRKNHIPQDCSGDLVAIINFPNCWDGVNLDSADHKSHMAYANGSECPASHPVSISNITGNVHYTVTDASKLRLSSDNYEGGEGGYSLHMDYVFAWDQEVLDTWYQNCEEAKQDCHANLLGDGNWLY